MYVGLYNVPFMSYSIAIDDQIIGICLYTYKRP